MSDTATDTPPATDTEEIPEEQKVPFPCEVCGVARATYVLADLEKADTSLFCGKDLILTFAKVANDMFAEQS